MQDGKYTTEESLAALALTVEEIEELERQSKAPRPTMGKYGSLFWDYLREYHPGRRGFLLSETTLRDVCLAVNREAREMMETLQVQFHKQSPRPKDDFMAAVRYETAIRDRAEEIVLREIVFKPR
jgi:hypothetical protein